MTLLRQEGWTRWPTEVLSNPYHSVILWFCGLRCGHLLRRGPPHGLQGNLRSSTWSTSSPPCVLQAPWCLQDCFSHSFSSLLTLLPIISSALVWRLSILTQNILSLHSRYGRINYHLICESWVVNGQKRISFQFQTFPSISSPCYSPRKSTNNIIEEHGPFILFYLLTNLVQ